MTMIITLPCVAPRVQFSSATYTVSENNGSVGVTVTRNRRDMDCNVSVFTQSGTAIGKPLSDLQYTLIA